DHKHERVRRHPRPPLALVRDQPGVEGGLRLLEQDDVGKAGLVRGGERQLSGHLVERRGHGEHDVLRGERLGKRRIPRLAQVTENARGGLDRRDARDPLAGAPGEDRGRSVDAAVAEPRLGRGDEPARHASALLAREQARAEVPPGGPGKVEAPRRQIVRAGQVDEGRQGRAGSQLAGRDELRHVEGPDRPARLRIDPRAGGVRRAEVDADDEAGRRHARYVISTSAGAMTRGSCPRRTGSVTVFARQPAWRSTPRNGGEPVTLPVSRIAAGSKPPSTVTASPSAPASTGSSVRRSRSARRQPSWMSRAAPPTCSSPYGARSSSRKSTKRPSAWSAARRPRAPCSAASAAGTAATGLGASGAATRGTTARSSSASTNGPPTSHAVQEMHAGCAATR